MNSVNIIGRLTKDIELKETQSGKKVCSFRIAVSNGKDRPSYFFSCVAWNETAKNLAKFFHKGDMVGLSGNLTSREYEDADGNKKSAIEILVLGFDFCNGGRSNNEEQAAEPQPTPEPSGQLPFEI